jgi:hypothetical protein
MHLPLTLSRSPTHSPRLPALPCSAHHLCACRLQEGAEEKQAVVQKILGLSESEAANLRSIVQSGGFKMGQQAEEEEAAFF